MSRRNTIDNGDSGASCASSPSRVLLVLGYLFPLSLSVLVLCSVLRNERVYGSSWEFTEYGSIARNLNRGSGAVSGSFQPYDLALLAEVDPRPTPPIAVHNRTLLPMWLTRASVGLFGAGDLPVMLPHLLMFLVLVLLTHHLERRCLPGSRVPFAATWVASAPAAVHSAIQCYPNVMFAGIFLLFLWLAFRAGNRRSPLDATAIAEYVALAVAAGLAQLARSEFAICLPLVCSYFLLKGSARAAWRNVAVVVGGWASLNAFEWRYALTHYGTPLRSETFWTNLTNAEYGNTWLSYIHLDRMELIAEHWPALLDKMVSGAWPLFLRFSMDPVRHLGDELGYCVLALVILGLLRTALRARTDGYRLEIVTLALIALTYVFMFLLLRPGARYFIWTFPFFGILVHKGLTGLVETVGAGLGQAGRRRAAGAVAALASLPLCLGLPASALAGRTRHHVVSPTAYYYRGEDDGRMRRIMEASLSQNFPLIRQIVPENAVVMTDEPALHWYADRLAMYLPTDLASVAAIEREWFPLCYVYLGPTMWFERGQPLGNRYRHYMKANDGAVPPSFDGKLEALLAHFDDFVRIRTFDNGGVLLGRRHGVDTLCEIEAWQG